MSLSSLNPVLRALMTAVHQQFIHILLLKAWNEPEMATAITTVDKLDFPVVMQLTHRIVALGGVPALCPETHAYPLHLPVVGESVPAILASDAIIERRLFEALAAASVALSAGDDRQSLVLIGSALKPRARHLAWLRSMARPGADTVEPAPARAIDVLFAQLIAFIEQTLVHAFALWVAGAHAWADAAWASSGAAMVQADRMVRVLAGGGAVPRPALAPADLIEAPQPAADPGAMLARDRVLAGRCRDLANLAAQVASNGGAGDRAVDEMALAALLSEMSEYYGLLSEWRGDGPHPAVERPAAFRSFRLMLECYVPGALRATDRHAI